MKNVLLSTPTLAIKAGSSAVVKHSAFQYLLNNLWYTKAAADCPALTGSIADNFAAIYTFTIDSAGTTAVYKSDDFAYDGHPNFKQLYSEQLQDGTNALLGTNEVIVGWVVVVNDTGSAFTAGTTALDVANLTVYYINAFGIYPQDIVQ